jgi:hypothetical protein
VTRDRRSRYVRNTVFRSSKSFEETKTVRSRETGNTAIACTTVTEGLSAHVQSMTGVQCVYPAPLVTEVPAVRRTPHHLTAVARIPLTTSPLAYNYETAVTLNDHEMTFVSDSVSMNICGLPVDANEPFALRHISTWYEHFTSSQTHLSAIFGPVRLGRDRDRTDFRQQEDISERRRAVIAMRRAPASRRRPRYRTGISRDTVDSRTDAPLRYDICSRLPSLSGRLHVPISGAGFAVPFDLGAACATSSRIYLLTVY